MANESAEVDLNDVAYMSKSSRDQASLHSTPRDTPTAAASNAAAAPGRSRTSARAAPPMNAAKYVTALMSLRQSRSPRSSSPMSKKAM